MSAEVRLTRQLVEDLDRTLSRCVLRLQSSLAPESRALGEDAEEALLALTKAVAGYDKLVQLHGGEGRRPEYLEGTGDLLPFPASGKES